MKEASKHLDTGRLAIIGKSARRAMGRCGLKCQRGFTLIELLAVMSILGVLAALVSTSVGGLGATSNKTRLEGDVNTIGSANDRFFNDAFPQVYPVRNPDTTGDGIVNSSDLPSAPAGDVGVREIDFDARLPQNPAKGFVPDFLKEVPDSAALVSWRIDTTTGNTFFTEQGAALVRRSEARLDVTAKDNTAGVSSDHVFTLTMKKNEAAIDKMNVQIPAGYTIRDQALPTGKIVGTLEGTFGRDNPWDSGHTISFFGTLETTGTTNVWELKVDYDVDGSANQYYLGKTNSSTSGTVGASGQRTSRIHTVAITEPTLVSPGKLTITLARGTDPAHNQATEIWKLTVLDFAQRQAAISGVLVASFEDITPQSLVLKNPAAATVARWLPEAHSTIDVKDSFERVAGSQSVVIKAVTVTQ